MAIKKIKKSARKVAPVASSPKLLGGTTADLRVMTPLQYATLRGISLQIVCRRLKEEKLHSKTLIGVKSYALYGRFYLLTVDMNIATPK